MAEILKRLAAALNGETLVCVLHLPDELREPIRKFLRPGTLYITVPEMQALYDHSIQLLAAREQLYRQEASTAQAAMALQLTRAMTAFVSTLTPDERALLQLRMETRTRFDFERLERRNAELERELSHFRGLVYAPTRDED